MKKIICKTCDPLKGNGYCATHSTSGMAYLMEEDQTKPPLKGWGCVLRKRHFQPQILKHGKKK